MNSYEHEIIARQRLAEAARAARRAYPVAPETSRPGRRIIPPFPLPTRRPRLTPRPA